MMAVYISANTLEVPAVSDHGWSDEERDEEYFLQDPDQTCDQLPQPYRMLDKMVTKVIDRAWEVILQLQVQREVDKMNALIPHYQSSEEVTFPSTLNCLANSTDKKYIFAGLANGLSALNTESNEVTGTWLESAVEIVSLQAMLGVGSLYVLSTIDNIGVARLFVFYTNSFYLVKTINATDDPSKRNICIEFQLSAGGEFASITFQEKEEYYLEIYRLLKDAWLSDLEQMLAAPQKHVSLKDPPRQSQASGLDDIKLAAPVLTMRLRPKKFPESSWKTLTDAHQKIGITALMGTGHGHAISAQQWREEAKIFEEMYKNSLAKDTTTGEAEESPSQPRCYFLMLGRVLPVWMDNKSYFGTLGVWWTGNQNIYLYVLTKPTGKEKPDVDPKPDVVWPHARPICCATVNNQTTLLASGLIDGVITIWNTRLGMAISVLPIQVGSIISSMDFLGEARTLPNNSYDKIAKPQILVTCKSSEVFVVTTSGYTAASICTLRERTEDPESSITAVQVVPSMSTLIFLTFRNGSTALVDGTQGTICHFVLPSTHTIGTPWEPTFAFDASGHLLYIKVAEKQGLASASSVFVFSLVSIPRLKVYIRKHEQPLPPLSLISCSKQSGLFLQERIKSLKKRNEGLAECWNRLKREAL